MPTGPTMVEKKTRVWVELTCAEPGVAFRGEWPGPEGPEEILAIAREKAIASGLPVQVEIQGHGVWSIEPIGKVHTGRLFRSEKLPGAKRKRTA